MVVAPWLQAADPLKAAQAGTSAGLEYRGQDIQANEHAAALAQAAQEAQMSHQIEQEKVTGGLAQAKAQSDLEAQAAARKFQAQQGYQMSLDSGEDPVKSLLRFGPQMGASTSGLGQIMLENFKNKQAAAIPQPVMDPNNPKMVRGYTMGGVFHPVTTPRAAVPQATPGQKLRMEAAKEAVKNAVTPDQIKSAQAALEKLANEVDESLAGDGMSGDENQSPAEIPGQKGGASFDYEYDPKAGTFNQVGK